MTQTLTGAGNLGDFNLSDIIYALFNTHQTTMAPFALAGTPSCAVYKDDGLTQSTAGLTLSAEFDSVVGLQNIKIDTSADATFYSSGHDFSVVMAAGTVNSISVVGAVVARFSIGRGVNVVKWLAGVIPAVAITGVPIVDTKYLVGVAQSATDLKDFADTGYDPSTHLVAGVATIASVTALGAGAIANVVTAVHTELESTARAELAQGAPAANASLGKKIDYIYQWIRNKRTLNKTTGLESFYADDASTTNQKRTAADDGTTASVTEIATGA